MEGLGGKIRNIELMGRLLAELLVHCTLWMDTQRMRAITVFIEQFYIAFTTAEVLIFHAFVKHL